ncbi:hypothetical protein KIW84_050102 [Lathyrus oleraceus]|uniref:Uncharacterized protein n=1 Tax=Pisum sativum TaxID=3888 RepID=A0A9D4WHP6_PEA|nr:hypothetical protein KIW84_050102 [Pisum sativum]
MHNNSSGKSQSCPYAYAPCPYAYGPFPGQAHTRNTISYAYATRTTSPYAYQQRPNHVQNIIFLIHTRITPAHTRTTISYAYCLVPYAYDQKPDFLQICHGFSATKFLRSNLLHSVVSIVDVTKVTRSGRVFGSVFPKDKEESIVGKKVEVPVVDPVSASKGKSSGSNDLKANDDDELCDEELHEEGRNHNLALHISMNCKEDSLSIMLVDTESSLKVLPKSTLSKLSYQGAPMRYSGVIVKAFDGSRKTVIGEVDLPVKIGLSDFQITLQVMDIHLAYSCLLGRPWIHGAGAVTSTLHQKLKFVKSGKLVIVSGEKALLVSHLSSFSYVEVEDEVGTPF